MNALIDAAVSKIFLQLTRLYNSAPELDMKLEDIVNDYVGFHPLNARLQKELRVGLRQCNRCNFHCVIATGKYGRCHSVANIGTTLVSTNYGLVADTTTSTVESYDFFHYKPDSPVLAIAGLFCNFTCEFCMNAPLTHIKSMYPKLLDTLVNYHLKPSDVVDMAKKAKVKGVIFGISEPTMNLSFILDVAPLARQAGLFVALQSNGYMSSKAIELLDIDGVVVGVKSFDDAEIYNKWIRGVQPQHVLNSIRQFHARGVHVEVTNLVLKSDNVEATARQASNWLANNVSAEIPLHILKMTPSFYSMSESDELSSDEVARIAAICRDSALINVYTHEAQDIPTYCSNCDKIVVQRTLRESASRDTSGNIVCQPQYDVDYVGLKVVEGKGYCANCRMQIYGKW
jgi:pyruvate formate lyase activating enzyme